MARRFDVDSTYHSEKSAFLHLCTAEQLAGVVDRYFAGRTDLVVLTVDAGVLGAELRWEAGIDPQTGAATTPGSSNQGRPGTKGTPPDGPELFPHLYGPLPLTAVTDVRPASH